MLQSVSQKIRRARFTAIVLMVTVVFGGYDSFAEPFEAAPKVDKTSDLSGLYGVIDGGMGADLWSGSNARQIEWQMLNMPTLLPVRHQHHLMRRALTSFALPPKSGHKPGLIGNFSAARGNALLRMGELHSAKLLIDQVPPEIYTPLLYSVAQYVHLASSDILPLCPMAHNGYAISYDETWKMIQVLCATIGGDEVIQQLTLDQIRNANRVNRFDLRLMDLVATAISRGSGADILSLDKDALKWPDGARLTSYRMGMVMLARVPVPKPVMRSSNRAVKGWLAIHPNAPVEHRLEAVEAATSKGILNPDVLVSLWALQDREGSAQVGRRRPAALLQEADRADNDRTKIKMLRTLWAQANNKDQWAAYRLVSVALARELPLKPDYIRISEDIVAALILNGDAGHAKKWFDALRTWVRMGKLGAVSSMMRVWPLALLVNDPGDPGRVPRSTKLMTLWLDHLDKRAGKRAKGRLCKLFTASVLGLKLLPKRTIKDLPTECQFPIDGDSPLTLQLRMAAQEGKRGEVILIAAFALGNRLEEVNARNLYAVMQAYAQVGLQKEAGLIAAEIILRLSQNGA